MRYLSATGIVVRACRAPRQGVVRLEHVTGQPLFLLVSEKANLLRLIGQVVRVTGRDLGRVIGTDAPLLEVTELKVLAPASLLLGGVEPFGPAILRTSVPDDEFRLERKHHHPHC